MNLSLLREIESSFVEIAPTHLTLHGAHVHPWLEGRTYSLLELREVLLDRATPNLVRDALWRHTMRAARRSQERMVGALGLAMPLLRGCVGRACRGLDPDSAQCVEAELVAFTIRQIRTATLDHGALGYYLLCRVRRAALGERKRALAAAAQRGWGSAEATDLEDDPETTRSAESVLQAAVRAGTVTAAEAELIARTRLEKVSLVALSTETGVAYKTLAKRRQRAESRLAAALSTAPGRAPSGPSLAVSAPVSPGDRHRANEVARPEASKTPWPLAS
ncbi:sigma-70 family RNA polymerase sigma factor [Nocardiopsis sp. MG754419]|uniref:sigma-70 family RNA polymerase sigma factor n=1 Tax=Nocardiopsis sp. MG754419 TaxID=2259865 RepID=UPI001BA7D13F|nr:sigma-70 family RNA polymerase sigma factor [Nocardiopsis sp. MG754419]MBR8741445.1 sigma-70 family RNA polymerase sigma factor [Nocardiopsis sp. MG754419]